MTNCGFLLSLYGASLIAQSVKNLPAMQVWFLGWEDPLEEGMATHSSILAWRIPWTEKPARPWGCKSQSLAGYSPGSCKSPWGHKSHIYNLGTKPPLSLYAHSELLFTWNISKCSDIIPRWDGLLIKSQGHLEMYYYANFCSKHLQYEQAEVLLHSHTSFPRLRKCTCLGYIFFLWFLFLQFLVFKLILPFDTFLHSSWVSTVDHKRKRIRKLMLR